MSEEINPYAAGPGNKVTPSTPPEDRIPFQQKAAYAVGMLVNNLQAAALPAMMIVLNLGLGINPILVGIIGFIPRIFDAVSDPLMGYISDNTRSRWGRRRPYILIGALISGLVFAAMWQVPTGWPVNYERDADADGVIDRMELRAGSDPNNVNSPVVDGGQDTNDSTGPADDGISDALEQTMITLGSTAPITTELDADGDEVPDYDQSRQSYYFWAFLIALVIYFLTYTMYATPFVAFGYEMTPDYHERTRLHAFANAAGQLAWLGAPWIWYFMSLYENKVDGASQLGMIFGISIMILGMVPAIFCRERMSELKPVESKGDGASGLLNNFKEFFKNLTSSLKCSPFVKLCLATFLVFNGFQLGISFSLYVMIYYVFQGGENPDALAGDLNGWWGSLTAICTMAVIPLTAVISEWLGSKRKAFMVTIGLSIIGYALKWIGYNPAFPYLLLISCPFVAFGTGSLFTLMGSMISDVCDYDELQSHQRREGVFGAIYWWMVKVGMALAGLLTGYLLVGSGFVTPLPGATEAVVQTDSTLLYLRMFDVVIPIVTSVIAMAIMASYEITEERAKSIRAELEQRRGKLE
ncbi:MFS transporter [Mariniblastus fucicola]|uniref:Inner membrane symporter YihP n=1 Tax=Mariniblastus fucicola TaxID=980251 RepID=A0A5B9P1L7_9BACT|nr:MFS transporter [Mariniblastus fucicola]QEG20208.1 Inner membrane symporter YihP [Mariniblastus fucicola]